MWQGQAGAGGRGTLISLLGNASWLAPSSLGRLVQGATSSGRGGVKTGCLNQGLPVPPGRRLSGSGGEAPYIQAFIHSFFKKIYYLFIWLCEVFLFFIYLFFWWGLFKKFIYLFLAVLSLHCCAQAFSSCTRGYSSLQWGLLFVALSRLLIAVASLVVEHGIQALGLSSCGSQV